MRKRKNQNRTSTTVGISKANKNHIDRWAKQWQMPATIAVNRLVDSELKREELRKKRRLAKKTS